jgi:hypothetical protein
MMLSRHRSYDIELHIGDPIGFDLTCYEDDAIIHKLFFVDYVKAAETGEKFLDGKFIEAFYKDVAATI